MSHVTHAKVATGPSRFTVIGAVALVAVNVALAMYSVADKGLWPEDWPAALEPYRQQARTLQHSAPTVCGLRSNRVRN